jgi:hypothetical protein
MKVFSINLVVSFYIFNLHNFYILMVKNIKRLSKCPKTTWAPFGSTPNLLFSAPLLDSSCSRSQPLLFLKYTVWWRSPWLQLQAMATLIHTGNEWSCTSRESTTLSNKSSYSSSGSTSPSSELSSSSWTPVDRGRVQPAWGGRRTGEVARARRGLSSVGRPCVRARTSVGWRAAGRGRAAGVRAGEDERNGRPASGQVGKDERVRRPGCGRGRANGRRAGGGRMLGRRS